MTDRGHRETAIVEEKTYNFLLWLLPKVETFPRSFRFTVGKRMEAVGLRWHIPHGIRSEALECV